MGNNSGSGIGELRNETEKLSIVNQKLAQNQTEIEKQANDLAVVQMEHENCLAVLSAEETKLKTFVDNNVNSHKIETEKQFKMYAVLASLKDPEEQLKAFQHIISKRPTASDFSVLN